MKENKNDVSNKYNMFQIAHVVLSNLNMNNIFVKLIDHCNDQTFLTCHRIHLVKSIVLKYIKTRYFYIAKNGYKC